jgi:hypothetical protein
VADNSVLMTKSRFLSAEMGDGLGLELVTIISVLFGRVLGSIIIRTEHSTVCLSNVYSSAQTKNTTKND